MLSKILSWTEDHETYDVIRRQIMETLLEETVPANQRYDPKTFARVYVVDMRHQLSPVYLAALIETIRPYSPMPMEIPASNLWKLKKSKDQFDELSNYDFVKQQADPLIISGFDYDQDGFEFEIVKDLIGDRLSRPKVSILLTTNANILSHWPAAKDAMRKNLFWQLPNNIQVPDDDFKLEA